MVITPLYPQCVFRETSSSTGRLVAVSISADRPIVSLLKVHEQAACLPGIQKIDSSISRFWCCVVFSVTERSYDVLGSTEEPLVSPVLMLDNQYGGYHPVDTRRNLSSETSPSCNWLKGNLVQRQTNDLQVVPLYWEGISTGKKVKCTGIRVSISSRMWWKDWRWGQSIWVHHFLLTASYTLQDWRLYFHFQCTHTEVMLFQRGGRHSFNK